MKKFYAALLVACCVLSSALTAASSPAQTLQVVLDQFIVANPTIPGVMVSLQSDRLDLSWQGASGVADITTAAQMAADQPLRLASTTKTYVAAATLRLIEMGKLDLNDTLDKLLPKRQLAILKRGSYKPKTITVRHLLTHTSGIWDFAQSDAYVEVVSADPNHRWTRDEQLEFTVDRGQPYGAAGEYYHYSDGGYILLGEIIERRSRLGLAAALRKLLKFRQLGLKATWLEILEPEPRNIPARAHQYFGDLDTNGWDASLDLYGGGGLVANMPDLAKFFAALFRGEVFDRASTLTTMLTSVIPHYGGPNTGKPGYGEHQYCLGVYATEYRGYTMFQHGGFWGTRGVYVPALDLALAMAVTQQQSRQQQVQLFKSILDVIIDAQVETK